MRYSGPVNISVVGDDDRASQYIPLARTLLGQLINQAELSRDPERFSARSVILSDGTNIEVRAVGPVVREIFIDVTFSEGFVQIMQYMFSVRGAGTTPAPAISITDEFNFVQSAWVAVIVVFREGAATDVIPFPLVSTRDDIKPNEDDNWPFVEVTAANFDTTFGQVVNLLPIPRYEIAHAETKHLSQPDKLDLIHAPWNQMGIPPYNAYAHTKATQWFPGIGTGISQEFNGVSVSTSIFDGIAYSKYFKTTDVGYEADLNIYQRPEAQTAAPAIGQAAGGAPDMDWYTSYSRVRVQSEFGFREYGVAIDANQKLYVWPTAAEGTADTSGSPYTNQSIKTSVADTFVKSKQLMFPSDVYVGDLSYRDNFGDSPTGLTDLAFDASRYTWVPDSTGRNFATVGMRYQDFTVDKGQTGTGPQAYWGEFGHIGFPDNTPPPTDNRMYRFSESVVLELGLQVTTTGEELSDFEISVGQVTVIEVEDTFSPVKVGYAGNSSFEGSERDELLVAGIEGFFRSSDEVPYNPGSSTDPTNPVGFHILIAGFAPREFTALAPAPRITASGQQFFSYTELKGRYSPVGGGIGGAQQGTLEEGIAKWLQDRSLEAKLSVRKISSNENLFSVCIRRALFPLHASFASNDYFTAEIEGVDLEHGVVALTTRSCIQDPQLREFRLSGPPDDAPFRDPWLSTTITCKYPQGFFILRGGEVIYRWTQDEGEMEEHLAYEPIGSNVDKQRVEVGMTASDGSPWDFFLGDYYIDLFNAITNNGVTFSGFYDYSDYRLGHEMYAFLQSKHFGEGYFLGGLVVNEDMVSFTGSLLCYSDGEFITNATDNQLTGVTTAFNKELDVIIFAGGVTTTHKELWEEAFGRTLDTEMDIRLESENVDTWLFKQGDDPLISIDIYRNHMIVVDGDGADTFKLNLDEPSGWMYPAFRKNRGMGFGLFPQQLNNDQEDAKLQREQQTLLDPSFSGRAYGYTR